MNYFIINWKQNVFHQMTRKENPIRSYSLLEILENLGLHRETLMEKDHRTKGHCLTTALSGAGKGQEQGKAQHRHNWKESTCGCPSFLVFWWNTFCFQVWEALPPRPAGKHCCGLWVPNGWGQKISQKPGVHQVQNSHLNSNPMRTFQESSLHFLNLLLAHGGQN